MGSMDLRPLESLGSLLMSSSQYLPAQTPDLLAVLRARSLHSSKSGHSVLHLWDLLLISFLVRLSSSVTVDVQSISESSYSWRQGLSSLASSGLLVGSSLEA